MRRSLKRAIAWRAYQEILRHHPSLDLRILQTQPGSGQYDCLTLVRWPGLETVCEVNVSGSGLRLGAAIGRPRPVASLGWHPGDDTVWRYPGLGLKEGRLAAAIEDALGFPDRATSPPTTPSVLASAVLAELLERVAFSPREVDLRCGWKDSSYGASIRSWARPLPALETLHAEMDRKARARLAARYWGLARGSANVDPAVIVDLATSRWWAHGEEQPRLSDSWGQGAGIRALAWAVEEGVG